MYMMRGLLVVACLAAIALQSSAKPQQERRGEQYQLYRRQRNDYDLPAEGRLNPSKLAAVLQAALGNANSGSSNGSDLPTSTITTITHTPTTSTGSSTTSTTPSDDANDVAGFEGHAVYQRNQEDALARQRKQFKRKQQMQMLGRREDEDEVLGQRYRLYKRNADRNVEGRSLAQLLALKGGSSGSSSGNCAPDTTTTTEIFPSPSTTSGSSTESITPSVPTTARGFNDDNDEAADDQFAENDDDDGFANDEDEDEDVANVNGLSLFRRGSSSSRPGQVLTLQEYEIRRQAEENKELRKRIEVLRRQNMQNIRRAQRARRQQRRRNKNQRRRSAIRNRNIRRRLQNRHRNNRRRLRRNRRRN
ncbi:uncharacterized protein Dmoj_GI11162 [Drosophila mojavensis]|uniref:Uncharacterized protein n=1 Tax=Drosophila mojavensis TaxID=7230 RepID=A0A0Q9XSJ2_DROMO|nr:uncharacterized protein Dmoj_GI11162 [Drosophila mojavensis]